MTRNRCDGDLKPLGDPKRQFFLRLTKFEPEIHDFEEHGILVNILDWCSTFVKHQIRLIDGSEADQGNVVGLGVPC